MLVLSWYEYLIYGAAIFFTVSWGLGLILSPRNRTGGNIATVILWAIALALSLVGSFGSLHLLWIFPVCLVVPALLLMGVGRL